MKLKLANQSERIQALTRFDVLVTLLIIILLFAVLFAMILPVREAARRRADLTNCMNNLRQINLAYRVWENDNERSTFNSTPVENLMPLNSGQRAWINVVGLTNLMFNQKVFHCPADPEKPGTNPAGFNIRISYFLNLDASEKYPQMVLAGDDNLAAGKANPELPWPTDGPVPGNIPVKPGIFEISTNTAVSWTGNRHGYVGNVGLADGSVSSFSSHDLQQSLENNLQGTPIITNRLAIP